MKLGDNNSEVNIDVIVTSYNSEKYIACAIESVRKQTFTSWNLIIVDDFSSDHTRSIVQHFIKIDSRIRLICSDKRSGGPATGRNRGVRESNANLIAFLDADDVWHPQKLELQIVYAFKNFENVFTCTSMHDFRFDGELEFPHLSRGVITRIGFREQCFRARIPASSVVMTRSLALAYPFNESPNYKAVEDFDCWLRILSSGVECSKLTQSLLYYRKSNSQISKSKVEMLKKVFMVHRSNPRIKFQRALLYTISHAISGIYYRLYKKSL